MEATDLTEIVWVAITVGLTLVVITILGYWWQR